MTAIHDAAPSRNATWRYILGRLGMLLAACLVLFLCGSLYFAPKFRPASNGTAPVASRVQQYLQNKERYNLLFVGDSRTYVGIHPEKIDPLLGSRSLSLASFSNWMPTNLALIEDLAPHIPKGTTIVWSVGHVNFVPGQTIQRVYPIPFPLAIWYERIGLDWKGLWDNVFFYNRFLNFAVTRGEFFGRIKARLNEKVRLPSVVGKASAADSAFPSVDVTAGLASRLIDSADARKDFTERMMKNPQVALVDFPATDGKINSIVLFLDGGGYFRIELDHAFFRSKQILSTRPCEDDGTCSVSFAYDFDPVIVRLFEEGLRTLKKHGVDVIVNELEETPYVYPSKARRQKFRDKMQSEIASIARKYGYPYVTTDLDSLESKDYFDYNHLNSDGIAKYSPMLAKAISEIWQSKR